MTNVKSTCPAEIHSISDGIVNVVEKAYAEILTQSTFQERKKWIKLINKNIMFINNLIKNSCFNIAILRKLHTNLGHLKRFRILIKEINLNRNRSSSSSSSKQKRSLRVRWEELKTAFSKRVRSGIVINIKHIDIIQFFKDAFFLFKRRINLILKQMFTLKVICCFCGEFVKKGLDEEIVEYKYFDTPNEVIDLGTNLEDWFNEYVVDIILAKLSEFQERDSGYALQKVISLEININKLEFGNGGSSYIKLPPQIAAKHACVNVRNSDNACFFLVHSISIIFQEYTGSTTAMYKLPQVL